MKIKIPFVCYEIVIDILFNYSNNFVNFGFINTKNTETYFFQVEMDISLVNSP